MNEKIKVATVWLDGCSGCHMSLIDMDERLIALAAVADFVYSPLVDAKEFPEQVDLAIVEGSVSTDEDEEKIRHIRTCSRYLVALGDCAVAGNIPAMRNSFKLNEVLARGYIETADVQPGIPSEGLPVLAQRVRPIHEVVDVDVFVQGCPPSADTIFYAISELAAGRIPDLAGRTRPGA